MPCLGDASKGLECRHASSGVSSMLYCVNRMVGFSGKQDGRGLKELRAVNWNSISISLPAVRQQSDQCSLTKQSRRSYLVAHWLSN